MTDISVSLEMIGIVVSLLVALGSLYHSGIKRGEMDNRIKALEKISDAQTKTIDDIRAANSGMATSANLNNTETRIQAQIATLQTRVDDNFHNLMEHITRLMSDHGSSR